VSALSASRLQVDFGVRGAAKLRAVDDVSFDLVPGKTVALVGESGSGKSTVVRVLGRLLDPTAGQILLDDAPVRRGHRALRAYRRRVQVIFQDPFASLNPAHSVAHHLRRPLLVNGVARRRTVGVAVEELLRSVNLLPPPQMARRYPHELSGGQRQRVAIARSLAPSPDILLADEPVSMLDVSIRLEILNLLDELKRVRNLALLYVTHDLATARHFSSEILVMYRGEIVERGPADEVILDPRHPYTQLLASAAPAPRTPRPQLKAARLARQASRDARVAERHEAAVEEGCRFRARCPFAMDVCRTRPGDLEVAPGRSARCWLYAPGVRNGQSS
jgi:peptide/nickel transport system ATP-binding protein